MKPRDSSDEEHDRVGQPRGEPAPWAVAPPAGSARSPSGVVAAAGPQLDRFAEADDEATTVGPVLPPLPEDQHVALSRRIRTALGQTLPLGTPLPSAAANGARRSHGRTMQLGGRQLPGLPTGAPMPSARERSSESPEARERSESVTPSAPTSLPPALLRGSASAPATAAVRASFVRTVGLPTAPPPRRSRRPGAPESELPPPSEPAAASEPAPTSDADHEAFALERPLALTGTPAVGRRPGEGSASRAAVAGAAPVRHETSVRGPATAQMLPPPPQPADYEPPSTPSSLPPAPRVASAPAAAAVAATRAPPAPARPLLTDLPSANPFEGFEAPRETFVQRFLIVFVVALAVVGLFALAAMAFGLLGKIGW